MKISLQKLVLLLVFIFFNIIANATHIVGGDVTYKCLGDDTYQIIVKVYKDCNPDVTGFLDQQIPLATYRGSGNDFDLIRNTSVPLNGGNEGIENIPPPESPCLILPEDICVEQGTYYYTTTLPQISESYYFVYQRCCRNNFISNIVDPDKTGATFSIEITPEAQRECNNAPEFNSFPPTVICVNEPLSIDHSATDAEGDQLVYELCSPLAGGGQGGGGPGSDPCNAVIPDPPCPPPYDPVTFVLPTYTPLTPMAGDPAVTINPLTGIITGTPENAGQFVVGVCVKEYRNGTLLSTVQRDFQFNVTSCTPTVEAVLDAPLLEIGEEELYVLNSCGDSSVTVFNKSLLEQDLISFYWRFDILGDTLISDDWSPSLTLPDTGSYVGTLLLNPGEICGDSAKVLINIIPPISADFLFDYDTCVVGDVSFLDASKSVDNRINSWQWNLGDGTTSDDQNPVVSYTDAGSYPISLIIEDLDDCADTLVQFIDWFPVPPLIVIEPNTFTGCPPANVTFNNVTPTIDNTYEVNWQFGDGQSGQDFSPTHAYMESGTYTVDVEIISPVGCITNRTFDNWITITPEPVADFTYSPQELNNFNATVTFADESQFANSWFWNFDGASEAYIENPIYTFRDTGLQTIELIVTHPNGCADTIMRTLDIVPEVTFYMPNAFTPNGDGENDTFKGKGYVVGLQDFRMEVWNRWGELIFATEDPDEGWNGTKNNTGNLSPAGVYVTSVKYTKPRGQTEEMKGYVTLLR